MDVRVSDQLNKNGGERRSKDPLLHKNTDIVDNNRTLTVRLRESSAEDTKVRAAKHVQNQEKVVWMWGASFVTVATTFLITVTKCASGRVVLMHCSGDTVQPTTELCQQDQLQLDAHGWWFLTSQETMSQRVRTAVTQLAFSVSYSYLDWNPRTHGMVLHTFRTGLLPPLILSGKT